MTKSTRRPWVLIGAVVMFALALSAVGPVLAQGGTTGGSGQTGTSVDVGDTDTLGTLVSRYSLSGETLRQFFSLNTGLVVEAGQTVIFPEGVDVNLGDAQGQGAAGGTGGTTTQAATDDAQSTPTTAGGAAGSGTADAHSTPTAAGGAGVQATPVIREGGDNTYVTQQGDTLGTLLTAMGFSASGDGDMDAQGTATVTESAGGTDAQTTPTAADSAGGMDAQSTPTVDDAGGGTGAGAQATPTAAGGSTGTGGTDTVSTPTVASVTGDADDMEDQAGVTDEQLLAFVTLNADLAFANDTQQTVMLPAGIPATGQDGTATATSGSESGDAGTATGTPAAGAGGDVTTTPTSGDDDDTAATATVAPTTGEDDAATATAVPTTDDDDAATTTAVPTTGEDDDATATATPAAGDAGAATATAVPTTDDDDDATATATPAAGGAGTTTATPAAGGQAGQTYTVQAGDTLQDIARRNGVTLEQLLQANPNLLTPGTTLNIPAASGAIPQTGGTGQGTGTGTQGQAGGTAPQVTVARCGEVPQAPAGYGFYKVQSGDSLASLSERFGVDVSDILSLNAGRGIFPGAIILLPGVEAPGQWNNENLRAPCAPNQNNGE